MPEVRRRRRRGLRGIGRRVRRRLQDRPRLALLAGAGLVASLMLLWSAWVLWGIAADLREAEDEAQIMRAALIRGDAAGAREALAGYQDAADSAASRADGPTWWAFERVPLLGDDAEGVAAVAEVLSSIGHQGLPPVADAAEALTADTFQPTDGVFPLERIESMAEPAQRSERAFREAATTLRRVDPSGFVGPVATRFGDLRRLVEESRDTLGSTYRASRLMPALLGDGAPRNYLLVFQNNAESRSSGGLPGSLSLVRAHNGEVDILEQTDMAALGATKAPILPLTEEERLLFGDILGRAGVDATLTPDVPRASQLIRARWEQTMPSRLDGVIFVDPVAVSYLLRGTGPVAVRGSAPVTPANVVFKVENEIYLQTSTAAAQSDYQNAVAKAVFDTFAEGRGDTVESIRGLVSGVAEGRVRMHLFGAQEQAEIAGTLIAGEFVDHRGAAPEVGIYVNDGGPTKMQYYLRRDASLASRSCVGDRQEVSGSITFVNDTPPDPELLPDTITGEFFPGNRTDPGQQILVVYLTTPMGGSLEELAIDGQRVVRPVVQDYAGREVATLGVLLDPEQTQTVEFVMRSAEGQVGDPRLDVSAGAFPGSPNSQVPSSCKVR